MLWNKACFVWGPAVIVAAIATGCAHGGDRSIPTQPFRDESEPDGFQYYESAVPSGDDGEKPSAGESTSETTIEIDVDDDSQDGSGSASADGSASGGDSAGADEGDDKSGDGDDGSDEDTAGGGLSAGR